MRAAIQQIGSRTPIVYGIGETDELAMRDAEVFADEPSELRIVGISDELAEIVQRRGGVVPCVFADNGTTLVVNPEWPVAAR